VFEYRRHIGAMFVVVFEYSSLNLSLNSSRRIEFV